METSGNRVEPCSWGREEDCRRPVDWTCWAANQSPACRVHHQEHIRLLEKRSGRAPLRRKLAEVDDFANALLGDPGEMMRAVGLALKSVLESEGPAPP